MSQSKPATARLQHIAAALNTRKRTSIAMLADELEVSSRTIQRDLEHMTDSLRLPIDADVMGHYFTEPVNLCRCCGRRTRGKS